MILWDLAEGKQLARHAGHSGIVYGVAFSPGGRLVASASEDGTAIVWNPAAKQAGEAAAWVKTWRTKAAADRAKDVDSLLTALSATDWPELCASRERLFLTGDEGARAAAETLLSSVARVADEARLKDLLAQLDNDEFAARVKAQRELKAQGRRIVPWLEARLQDAALSAEVRGALTDVLTAIRGADLLPAALARQRAVGILIEMPRTEGVSDALKRFAAGPKEDEAAEAARRALPR